MKAIGATSDQALRTVAQEYRERAVVTGTTMTLQNTPLQTVDNQGLELVFVNGALLDPGADYSMNGPVITFDSALTADVVVVRYPYSR